MKKSILILAALLVLVLASCRAPDAMRITPYECEQIANDKVGYYDWEETVVGLYFVWRF